jgi:hypothetical protein
MPNLLVRCCFLLVLLAMLAFSTRSFSERRGGTDRVSAGEICIDKSQVSAAISTIRRFGGVILRDPKGDEVCSQLVIGEERWRALQVPDGLEGWSLDRLTSQGKVESYWFKAS